MTKMTFLEAYVRVDVARRFVMTERMSQRKGFSKVILVIRDNDFCSKRPQ